MGCKWVGSRFESDRLEGTFEMTVHPNQRFSPVPDTGPYDSWSLSVLEGTDAADTYFEWIEVFRGPFDGCRDGANLRVGQIAKESEGDVQVAGSDQRKCAGIARQRLLEASNLSSSRCGNFDAGKYTNEAIGMAFLFNHQINLRRL